MRKIYLFIITVLLVTVFCVAADVSASPTVSYISSEGFYINGGINYNLQKNDTLLVIRGDSVIATFVISNISQNSSACKIVEKNGALQIGDAVVSMAQLELILVEQKKEKQIKVTRKKKNKLKSSENFVSGYISSQHYIVADMSSSSLSSYQPSVRSKLKVDNLFGEKLKLQIKHRSRYYKRSSSRYISQNLDNWSHRIYEFAIYSTDQAQAVQYSFGRQSVYQMQGVGFVDGLYLSKQINDKVVVGAAIGAEPDYLNQKIDFSRKKAGLFVAYTLQMSKSQRLLISGALAGSYLRSFISREYFYLQTDYSSNKITFNQSLEIDFFRTWRKEALNKRFSLTSYYGRANYAITDKYSFSFSFDTRERIHYYEDAYIVDSVFDDTDNRGLKFGMRLKPLKNLSISINTGLRMRGSSFSDNKYGSIAISALRFPGRKSSLTARFSYLETMFTTAYRPSLSYRFPLRKRMYVTLSGTTNIYSSTSTRSSTSYIDAQTYYTMQRNYFISGSIRQYFEKDLQSNQLFFEFGKHF